LVDGSVGFREALDNGRPSRLGEFKKKGSMMKLKRMVIVALCAAVVTACGKQQPPEDSFSGKLADVMEEAPEPPTLDMVAPEIVATLDRNEIVSVMLIDLPAGESIPEHDAGPRAIYTLTDSSFQVDKAGSADIRSYSIGEVAAWSAGTYSIENAGEGSARMVVVDRTSIPLPPQSEASAASEEPTSGSVPPVVLHRDDRWVIERLSLAPESSQAVRCGSPCAVFTLTPATLLVENENGEPEPMDVYQDRSVWFDAGASWSLETAEEPAAVVVFQIMI
jgi:hypothetical protein